MLFGIGRTGVDGTSFVSESVVVVPGFSGSCLSSRVVEEASVDCPVAVAVDVSTFSQEPHAPEASQHPPSPFCRIHSVPGPFEHWSYVVVAPFVLVEVEPVGILFPPVVDTVPVSVVEVVELESVVLVAESSLEVVIVPITSAHNSNELIPMSDTGVARQVSKSSQ